MTTKITLHHFVTMIVVFLTLVALILSTLAISGHIDFRDNSIEGKALKVDDGFEMAVVKAEKLSNFNSVTNDDIDGLGATVAKIQVAQEDIEHLAGHADESTASGAHTVCDTEGLAFKAGTNVYTTLKANSNATSTTFTLPITDGSANQVIKTDGSGNLSFVNNTATSVTLDNIGTPSGSVSLNGVNETIIMETNGAITIDSKSGVLTLDGDDQLILQSEKNTAAAIKLNTTNAAGGIDIDAGTNGVAIDTTGAFSVDGAAASNITVATGAADGDDLTISVTGGGNSSLILSSDGTGTDAVSIDATAGDMVIAPTLADGKTLKLGKNGATEMVFSPHGTAASEKISLTNTSGTAADAIAITATSGGLDFNAAGAVDINSSAGVINIGNDAVAQAINIGTGAAARTITVGNATGASALVINTGTGGISLASTGTGDITINSDDTLLLDADGVLELNSSGGAISLGNDADAQAINIGTGAAARTITVGNATGATALAINTGATGGIDFTALNTTTDAFDITANSVTTGNVIDISATGLTDGSVMNVASTSTITDNGTSKPVNLVLTNDGVGTQIAYGLFLDYNKTGITASGKISDVYGIHVDLDDSVTNVGNVNAYGLDVSSVFGNTGGTVKAVGAQLAASGADTNIGLLINCSDTNGTDLKITSSADTNDYFSITTIANGATTIETVDAGAAAANLTVNVDGTLSVNSAGAIDITTSASNSNITIDPNGSGTLTLGSDDNTKVDINALDIELDAGANGVTINSAGAIDITTSASNSNITIDPNGSGTLALGSADNTAVTVDAIAVNITSTTGGVNFVGNRQRIISTLADGTTLTAAQSGGTILQSTNGATLTLPATVAGLEYTFIFIGTAGHTFNISPNANDKIGGSIVDVADGNIVTASNSGAGTDNKDLQLDSGSQVGDRVTLVADGSLGWFIKDGVGSWVFES